MNCTIVYRSIAVSMLCAASLAAVAAPGDGVGDSPPPPSPCLSHLTRAADLVVTMQANKQEYEVESEDTPVTYWSPSSSIVSPGCRRRVIEIRVPYYASSGCDDCYTNAEVHACAGYFPGSKSFEEICRVPVGSTPEATCKSFNHKVDVYKKPAGAAAFNSTPVRSFVYKGFMQNGQCRVAAQYLGQIHDTSEVYPLVTPPASGTDVYRVLSYPVFNGVELSTMLSVHFEAFRQ